MMPDCPRGLLAESDPEALVTVRSIGLLLVIFGTLAACGVFGIAALAALELSCLDACPRGPRLWPAFLLLVPLLLLALMVLVARGVLWAGLLITAVGIVVSIAGAIVASWPLATVGVPLMLGGTMLVSPLRRERR